MAPERTRLSRRRFLVRVAAGVGAAGAIPSAWAWFVEPSWVEFIERGLPIANLPAPLHGACLIQMTDLHVGGLVPDSLYLETFAAVAARRPDFVVFTGDIVSWRTGHTRPRLERVFQHVPHGRLGTLAILGNHDWGRGWSEPDVADEVSSVLRECGVDVLRNDAREIAGLTIAGLDDFWSPGWKPEAILPALAPERPALVLCHNPDAVDRPGWGRFRGWVLAGHTHGGQVLLPFIAPRLPVKNRRYTSGEFELAGGRRLYINRGLGASTRIRFNARPEVTVFTLARA